MRIAVDAMGGDDAPQAIVEGACDYASANPGHQIILVGIEDDILPILDRREEQPANISVHHAPQVIGMGDK